MSTEFDDIQSLLKDVLDGKDVEVPTPEPEPEPEQTPVVAEASPDTSENLLGDFFNEPVEATPEALDPDSPEAIEAEVTQLCNPEEVVESTPEAVAEALTETTDALHDAVQEHEIAPEDATVPVSEHVFSEPVESDQIPLPTFTSDDISDSIDIRNFATLVTLNTARWQAKVKDRKAAKDAADASGAIVEAFEAKKFLLAGCDTELKAVYKAIDEARTEHYRLTLPWSTIGVNDVGKRTGGRLMPNTLFLEYTTAMAKYTAQMNTALDVFEAKYPSLIAVVAQKLGTAFDPAQYPNPSSIRQHFRLSFDFHPIPVGADFKGLQDAQIEKLSTALNRKTRTMLENAMQDAWKNLYEAVQHAYARLRNPDATFHKTLIDRLRDQANLLKHLNATDDTRMEEVRVAVEEQLTKHDAKAIREDDALRRRLSEAAGAIVTSMEEIANESA